MSLYDEALLAGQAAQYGLPMKLTSEELTKLRALQATPSAEAQAANQQTEAGSTPVTNREQWSGDGDLANFSIDKRRRVLDGGTEASGPTYSDAWDTLYYKGVSRDTWKGEGDVSAAYDAEGNFVGISSGDSEALSMAKFIAMSVGGYYAVGAGGVPSSYTSAAGMGAAKGAGLATARGLVTDTPTGLQDIGKGAVVGGVVGAGDYFGQQQGWWGTNAQGQRLLEDGSVAPDDYVDINSPDQLGDPAIPDYTNDLWGPDAGADPGVLPGEFEGPSRIDVTGQRLPVDPPPDLNLSPIVFPDPVINDVPIQDPEIPDYTQDGGTPIPPPVDDFGREHLRTRVDTYDGKDIVVPPITDLSKVTPPPPVNGTPGINDLLQLLAGIYGLKLAGDAADKQDPFGPYRKYYGDRLMELEQNPGLVQNRPGYRTGVDSVNRQMASRGYMGSGNQAGALMRFSGDFYNSETSRLAQLAGSGISPGNSYTNAAQLSQQALTSIGYGLAPFLGGGPK